MLVGRVFLPDLSIEVLSVSTARHCIVIPEQTSSPQLWKQKVDDILEGLRE